MRHIQTVLQNNQETSVNLTSKPEQFSAVLF